jgi:hypothetical protein
LLPFLPQDLGVWQFMLRDKRVVSLCAFSCILRHNLGFCSIPLLPFSLSFYSLFMMVYIAVDQAEYVQNGWEAFFIGMLRCHGHLNS